ncbi:hypothetical protein EcWSU1_01913 [Enterobacter ludwigii]|uniref:Uncharacterized protein n=1 Tax=Enterobacter ludwigii TaxID=299767 RepID=G8LM78_9ENTR|nr:hypothetical protein EcWSU1_01913 [Enterobacter ludwigii]
MDLLNGFVKWMWSDDHIQFELAWRNGDLASVARQNNALAGRETGITLFLYYHDGAAVIFTDFQFYALAFVHCTLNALACNTTRNGTCCCGQRTTCATAYGITEEATQHSTADGAHHVAVIATLNLYRTCVNNGTVSDALNLFGFRSAVHVARK